MAGKVNVSEAIKLYKQGFTLEEIGDKYGVTREGVRQHLKRNGVKRKDGGKTKVLEEEIQLIGEMASKGFSMELIAKKVKCDPAKVRAIAWKRKIEVKSGARIKREKVYEDIKKLHDSGLNQNEISAKLGVLQTTISQVLREKYGVISGHKVDFEEVKKLYQNGTPIEDIASKYDVTYTHIYSILKYKLGISPPKRKIITPHQVEKVIRLRSQGVKVKDISTAVSLGESTVFKILSKNKNA